MKFDVKVVRNFLLQNSVVYTVRGYRTAAKFGVVEVDGMDYMRTRMQQINAVEDLEDVYLQSGFTSAKDWWKKIEGFGAVGGYLYKVELLDKVQDGGDSTPAPEFKLTIKQAEFNEDVDAVLFTPGRIKKTNTVEVVRCPFEELIQASEMEVKLCPHAETCKLKYDLTHCTVPHLHNFFSPGDHINHCEMTVAEGYSLDTVLARVAKRTAKARKWAAAGIKMVKPKPLPRKAGPAPVPATPGLKTKAETYSVYEYNTTPVDEMKYLPEMTKADRWDVADRRESKRLEYIQLCRDAKINAMLGC